MTMPKTKERAVTSFSAWATDILFKAQTIAPCPDHGYLRLRHRHRAIDYAMSLAEQREIAGKTRKQRVKAVVKVLDGPADTCPACD
jgi:hypothetical protein